MKNNYVLIISLGMFLISCTQLHTSNPTEEDFQFVSQQLTVALTDLPAILDAKNRADTTKVVVSPRSIDAKGELIAVPARDWCSGFFPGTLWYMYEHTKEDKWRKAAEKYTEKLESVKDMKHTHDLGFMAYCSYGNGYRLTNNQHYRDVLLTTANSLITRYSPIVKSIRSWDFNSKEWKFPVIIDNMMNLELLFWASKETKDPKYYDIAVQHAKTTMKNHFRTDNSCYHVVDYDPETGDVRMKVTHQGYSDTSAWARGQAWALYGYVLCYRETKDEEFLKMAKAVEKYIFTNPNMPIDLVPYWDFDAPGIPNEPKDVSAAVVIASALYELSGYDKENGGRYKSTANTIMRNISEKYRAEAGGDYGFILQHSTGAKMYDSEVDVPLSYADYYYIEALQRESLLN